MITEMKIATLPAGRRLLEPMTTIVTFFGAGLLPVAPGTWGSLAALPVGLFWLWLGGWPLLVTAAIIAAGIGYMATDAYIHATGREDPPEVVIDEVATQWLVMAFVPLSAAGLFGAFFMFRLFDTIKPWPASWADQEVEGGLGVMLDDIIAGIYAIPPLLALDIMGFF
jgi:phosphatidylglycerophosphatase A